MIDMDLNIKINPKNIQQFLGRGVAAFVDEVLNTILSEAQKNLDKHGTSNTGRLAQSGRVEKTSAYEGKVIFGAPYAKWVEFGTRPHWAPLGPSLPHKKTKRGVRITGTPDPSTNPLDYWAWRRGSRKAIETKYGVHTALGYGTWLKIAKQGTDPQPYLRPALDYVKANQAKIAQKHGLEVE